MNKPLIFLIMLLLVTPVMAMSETIDIFGTNATNAQTNITKSGNQSVNVSIWTNELITFTINVTNITDTFAITLHNRTIGRVIEWRFNGSVVNATQADDTGTIRFTQIQTTGNRTYSLQPAVNYGGYNFTWSQFWTYPYIRGVNLSTIITNTITAYGYLPLSGTTSDLDMNNKNITNVRTVNSTTVNVTILNSTNIQGNGSAITNFNLTNGTGALPAVNGSALFGLNMSNQTTDGLTLTNVTIKNGTTINVSTLNATTIAGSGAEISALNATNLTNPLPALNATDLFGLNMTNSTFCASGITCTYNTNNSLTLTVATTSSNTTKAQNYTISTTSDYKLFISGNNGNTTVFLPKTSTSGQEAIIVKTDPTTNHIKIMPFYPLSTARDKIWYISMDAANTYYTGYEAPENINLSAILFLPYAADAGATDTIAILASDANGLPGTQLITTAATPDGLDHNWTYANLSSPSYVLLNQSSRYWVKHTGDSNGRKIWSSADHGLFRINTAWSNTTALPLYVFANLTGISGYTGNTTGGPYGNSSLFYPTQINKSTEVNITSIGNKVTLINDGTDWW